MIKELLKATTLTAVAISAAVLPNAAQAVQFKGLDLSNLQTIAGKSVGDVLLTGQYFDGALGVGAEDINGMSLLGTFNVVYAGGVNGSAVRPVGSADGNLTLATQPAGNMMLRIDFTPDPRFGGQLPSIKLTETTDTTPSPAAFNPFEANEESYTVTANGGTNTDWTYTPGGNNSPTFFQDTSPGGASDIASWTFLNDSANALDANTLPFRYDSNGTVASLLIDYNSIAEPFNAATVNIMTMGVKQQEPPKDTPEPSAILALGTLGLSGLLSKQFSKKRKED